MSLTPGTRIGPYEVVGVLGAGGMGEVYRAHDTRLNRDVALKVLPEAFASDAERLARFTREAQTLAALNHPNIAHLHGLEDSAGIRALVMELVEGPTLDEVIAAGHPEAESGSSRLRDSVSVAERGGGAPRNLSFADVASIARQIADALEAAHDAGVVHRDLKPSNIKVRPDGTVKVLDFGLAKAAAEASGSGIGSTMTSPAMTQQGVILGTAAYMSPEQAKGRAVDKRADIWSFGVVLFEMVSGTRLFDGETVTETIAAVIKDPLRLERLPADTPTALRKLIARCLERDPRLRLRDIGEARIALQSNDEMAAPAVNTTATRTAGPRMGVLAAIAAVLVALTGAAGWYLGSRTAPLASTAAAPFAAQIVPTPADAFAGRPSVLVLTFAPDGALIYASTTPTARMLYRKDRTSRVGVPIPGTEGAYGPFMSADGSAIGFFADGKIKHVPIAGGAAQIVHDLRATTAKDALALGWSSEVGPGSEQGYGATWLPDNTIVYGRMLGGLWRVPVSGGAPTPVMKDLQAGELAHRLPHALPDGKSVLMTVIRSALANLNSTVEIVDLATGARRLVVSNATDARFSRGRLLFAREGALYSVAFDPVAGTTSGDPVRIVDDLMHSIRGGSPGRASGVGQYAVSDDGTLVVLGGGVLSVPTRQMAWITPAGKVEPWPLPIAGYLSPHLSPDGARAAVFVGDGISLIDTRSYLSTSLIKEAVFPIWKPDGKGLIVAVRSSNQELAEVSLDGTLSSKPIAKSTHLLWPSSVSADGKWLAYVETNPATGNDIWVASVNGDAPPAVIANTAASETHPAFSPDGKWLVYAMADGGSTALYVRPFPGPGRAEKISEDGGLPVWADEGRTLFFDRSVEGQTGDRQLVRAPVEITGDRLRLGRHQVIATVRLGFATPVGGFDVWRDGRMVVTLTTQPAKPAAPPPPPTMTVIFNAIR